MAKVLMINPMVREEDDPKHVPMAESYRGNVSCQGPRACYDESKRVGETLSYIYNNLYGISMPFVKQKSPGPISGDIINNILKIDLNRLNN